MAGHRPSCCLERAYERLTVVVPDHLPAALSDLPPAGRGAADHGHAAVRAHRGFWLLYLLGYNQSVATAVGFIALAGVAAEFGVVMLIYLRAALERRGAEPVAQDVEDREGALLRVRAKAMTVAVILAGLFPILIGGGAGSEVMSRIAAPMIGGMITAPLLSMFLLPAGGALTRIERSTP